MDIMALDLRVLFCAVVVAHVAGLVLVPNMDYSADVKLGDINIGAILPIHQYNVTASCGGSRRELGVLQRMEALVFAIDEINNRADLLENITLGYVILDDCYKETTAVGKALQFVTAKVSCAANVTNMTSSYQCKTKTTSYDVIGIIGSESSANSMSIAQISGLYKIPQLSYLATSPDLDSTYRFPYFFRIVPSDSYQARALIDFLSYANWTYVSILYTDSAYGITGFHALQDVAKENGICFACSIPVAYNLSDRQLDKIISDLSHSSIKARAVILYAPLEVARGVLMAAKRNGHAQTFTWIASDAWGRNIQDYEGLEEVAWGVVAVKVDSRNVPRFDDYFSELLPSVRTNNPWFREFWDDVFNCSYGGCTGNERFSNSSHYTPDTLTSLVIDAVYAFAYAIDDAIHTNCTDSRDPCYLNSCLNVDVLTEALQRLSFQGETAYFTFDNKGNGILDYDFQNLQKINDSFVLVHVATWSEGKGLLFDGAELQFKNMSSIPKSVCSEPCRPGFSQEMAEYASCCWTCEPCRLGEISVEEEGTVKCVACHNLTWPDPTRTVCLDLIPEYLGYSSIFGAVLVGVAGLGVVATFLVGILFGINNEHKLIKASGRELCYVMLFGVWLHYSAVFVYILKPSHWSCIVNMCNFSLSFCLVYAPLLTKTNRIYRIFKSGRHGKIRPPMIDAKSQLMFTSLLVSVEVLLLVVWILIDAPTPDTSVTRSSGNEQATLYLFCSVSMGSFGSILGYNLLLIFACCFHAFKTRKLPTNFNESRFISFCVYTTVLMWLAFFPAYVALSFGYYRTLFSCLALLINATVLLICLFGTRLYGVYFVKKSDLHLVSTGPANHNMKSAALAVNTAVSMSNPGQKIVPGRGSEPTESREEMVEHSIETIETSHSDNDVDLVIAQGELGLPVGTARTRTDSTILKLSVPEKTRAAKKTDEC